MEIQPKILYPYSKNPGYSMLMQWLQKKALRADFSWPKADKRREFLRVKRNTTGGLDLFENQGSGVLTSTVWADGLVDNPPGNTIKPGDTVGFIPFFELMS